MARTARVAATRALDGLPGVDRIDAITEDGSTVVMVTVGAAADRGAVENRLGRYPLTYRITENS